VDVEAMCSDDGTVPRHEMEIIEIGAVIQSSQSLSSPSCTGSSRSGPCRSAYLPPALPPAADPLTEVVRDPQHVATRRFH
jgi:hypothetical protein